MRINQNLNIAISVCYIVWQWVLGTKLFPPEITRRHIHPHATHSVKHELAGPHHQRGPIRWSAQGDRQGGLAQDGPRGPLLPPQGYTSKPPSPVGANPWLSSARASSINASRHLEGGRWSGRHCRASRLHAGPWELDCQACSSAEAALMMMMMILYRILNRWPKGVNMPWGVEWDSVCFSLVSRVSSLTNNWSLVYSMWLWCWRSNKGLIAASIMYVVSHVSVRKKSTLNALTLTPSIRILQSYTAEGKQHYHHQHQSYHHLIPRVTYCHRNNNCLTCYLAKRASVKYNLRCARKCVTPCFRTECFKYSFLPAMCY